MLVQPADLIPGFEGMAYVQVAFFHLFALARHHFKAFGEHL